MSSPDLHHGVFSPEVIDVTDNVDHNSTKLRRKPIGWNYQNAFTPTITNEKYVNGSKSNNSDEIEILEVLEVKSTSSTQRPASPSQPLAFPPSSSRKEIKEIIRGTSQSSIKKFFEPASVGKPNGKVSFTKEDESSSKKMKKSSVVEVEGMEIEIVQSSKTSNDQIKNQECASTNISETSVSNKGVTITSEYSKSLIEKFVEKWRTLVYFSKDQDKIKAKLLKHYSSAHPTYIVSRTFVNAIEKGIENVTKNNVYLYITDIINNLKKYKDQPYVEKKKSKKIAKEEPVVEEKKNEVLDEAELKKKRRMARIEKEMTKTINKIKELEESEVDLDDMENSAYILTDRYKKHLLKLDTYYCKLAECSTYAGRPVDKPFRYRGSRYPEINKRISAWVTKHNCFPDYPDIIALIRNVTKKNNIPLKNEDIRYLGREIFSDVGRELKRRRMNDDIFCMYAYADPELPDDPALNDESLHKKLSENMELAKEKLTETFQFYVDKEIEMKNNENCEQQTNKEEETAQLNDEHNQTDNETMNMNSDHLNDTADVPVENNDKNSDAFADHNHSQNDDKLCNNDDDTFQVRNKDDIGDITNQVTSKSDDIISKSTIKTDDIISKSTTEADDIISKSTTEADDIISQITTEADDIISQDTFDTDDNEISDENDSESDDDSDSDKSVVSFPGTEPRLSESLIQVGDKIVPVEVLKVTNDEVDLLSDDENDEEIQEILQLSSPKGETESEDDEGSVTDCSNLVTVKRKENKLNLRTVQVKRAKLNDFEPETVELE